MGRRIWKIALVFVATAGAGGLTLVQLARSVDGRLEAHRVEIAEILEGNPVRRSLRPALLEPAEPGNAWDLLREALDEVGDLYPLESISDYGETCDANLDWRGVPADTPRLMGLAAPSLEKCRRAMRRSALEWTGPVDPTLPAKAGRVGRALCTKAIRTWEEGRDAEAAEWLVVAMGVAQDAARLGQRGTWPVLRTVERWACQEARLLMGSQDLTLQELELLGSRLDLVQSARPSFALPLAIGGALARQQVLEGEAYVQSAGDPRFSSFVRLDTTASWRDLFSVRLCRLRVLNGLRNGVQEMSLLPPSCRPSLESQAARTRARYSPDDVAPLLPCFFEDEDRVLQRLEQFRLAVRFAREKAETGRFPQTLRIEGVPVDLGSQAESGILRADEQSRDLELVWILGRRTRN